MKRLLVLVGLAAALAAPAAATAHPLGNFTINRYSRVDVSGGRLYALYVLDLAEIPTFQARRRGLDAGAYARRIAANVVVRVDGRTAHMRPAGHAIAFPRGAGGLSTTRLEVVLEGPALHGTPTVEYADRNYAGRIGWKEIVVQADRGASLNASSAPATSESHELRAYPKNLLQSPLDVTSARFTVSAGTGDGVAPALTTGTALQAPDRIADSGFASLVGRENLGTGVILLSLLLALFWGAAHAFSPGHGKAIVAGYLVGSRGNARHAALLGLIVTVTHTIGVFALGLVTLALSQFIVPDTLYPWLNLASALLVVAVGLATLRSRYREWAHTRAHAREAHHDHDHHHHGHAHGHEHGHSHAPEPGTGMRGLISVGISGGILPCPSALVVLLAAIALHRVGYGLLLIVAFSVGLAASVTGIGLVAVTAKRAFSRMSFDGRVVRALPALSAIFVLVLGVAMTVRALPHLI